MADQKLSELIRHNTILGSDSRLYSVVYPSGSPLKGYTEYEDIRDQISAYIGDAGNPLDNLLYVAKNGNDTTGIGSSGKPYLSISKALTTITTPGQTIIVAPGTYTETITFTQNYTTILGQQGSGAQESIIITQANTNVVDFGITLGCTIVLCNIQLTAAASTIYAVKVGVTGQGIIKFCRTCTTCTTGGILAGVGYSGGGTLTFTFGRVFYTNNIAGAGTEVKSAFRVFAGATLQLFDQKLIDINTDGASSYSVVASDEGTSGTIITDRSNINIDDDDALFTGFARLTGTSISHLIKYNRIYINRNTTNTGTGCSICNPSGNIEVRTGFNRIIVGQITGTAYSFTVAAGSILTSHFDDITAADGSDIAVGGTYNYVNSPADGDLQISGSYLNMYDQALTVGARGGDYTVIQDAINAITDATANKRYVILIYPGTYTENIVLTPYIDLKAISTRSATVITSATGTTLTLSDKTTLINDIKIRTTGGKILEIPAVATTVKYKFAGGTFHAIINDSFTDAIEIKGGTVQFSRSFMHYAQTGTGGGTHRLINITGAGLLTLLTTDMNIEVAAVGDDVVGIEEANEVITTIFTASRLMISRTGIVTGETIGYYANGTSADKLLSGCFLMLLNNGSGGNASLIKTAGNCCVVTCQSNTIKVLNFTNNWAANVAATDTVYSNFDTITAAQESTGAGTYNAIHAHSNGDFHVERDIVLQRNMEIGGTLALVTGTTVNEIVTVVGAIPSNDKLLTEKAFDDYIELAKADYIPKDGSVAFTSPVGSPTPTLGTHLTNKDYVDGIAGGGGLNDLGPFVTKDLSGPPGGETLGDKYIVDVDSTGTASGAWLGHEDDVATVDSIDSTGTTWTFETPVAGKHGWVTDEGIDYTFNGVSWVATGTLIDHTTIQNIGTNTHPQIDTHIENVTTNPHVVTKTNVGLGNVTDDAQLKREADDWKAASGIDAKVAIVDLDKFLMEDSEDGQAKKYVLASNMLDQRVKVSATDTVQDYLENKLIGTTDVITVTKIGTGGDEDLQINAGTNLETVIDGSNADALHTHLSGWHGSSTRIKIAPAEFFPNNSKEWKQVIENDGGSVVDSEEKLTEFITIPIYTPEGYKATAYMVYASANIVIEIFENNIANSSATSKGAGNANTEVNMTDVSSTTTNYLSIVVVDALADIYGAYVTIEAV